RARGWRRRRPRARGGRVRHPAHGGADRGGGGRRPMNDAPLLQVQGIDVSYGQTQVLFGVDLDVHQGEIVALLGTNGAGKSTVLKSIVGSLPPIAGASFYDGRDITRLTAPEIAALGIALVPGGKGVFPTLS